MQKLPTSLTHAIIQQTVKLSPDHGETLDFSHRNLAGVDESAARQLAFPNGEHDQDESPVTRIAMSYNRLTSLPSTFSLLSRLRYLNLRSNLFSSFPLVLTTLPALEILDISRNNIRSFPEFPGTISNLQILSISKNKLSRLPAYLASFLKLAVLKVDHNPLEWPPPEVLDLSTDVDDPEAMALRLRKLRRWLEENSEGSPTAAIATQSPSKRLILGSSPSPVNHTWSPPHSRSSSYDFVQPQDADSYLPLYEGSKPNQNGFGIGSSYGDRDDFETSSNASSTYSHSPSLSMQYEISATQTSSPPRMIPIVSPDNYLSTSANPPKIKSKKSLPDLRTIRQGQYTATLGVPKTETLASSPHPADSGHFSGDALSPYQALHQAAFSACPSATTQDDFRNSERNAYFKRFSIHMKPSTVKPISQALLSVIDSVRGIYFAIHQIYEQVDSYTSWTLDERISVILRKILEPAQLQISQIPLALDRFDLLAAHQSQPSVAVCRRVLESCRENIAVCGKVVAALQLHLKVLAGADDIRFTRSLVLMLYGSMAEIAHAWESILAESQEVKPYFSEPRPSNGGRPRGTDSRSNTKRSRNARRHAGSFSLRDVEIGRSMSSPPPEFTSDRGLAGGPLQQDGPAEPSISKARSPTLLQNLHRAPAPQHLELPDNSSQRIDRELVETISATITNAQRLWELLGDPNDAMLGPLHLSSKMLDTARESTDQLSFVIHGVQGGPVEFGNKQLFEETLSFIKTIAQVLTELKKIDSRHPLPPALRATTAKIAQSTKEIAVLLHVSSYSPNTSATPTPHGGDDEMSLRSGVTGLARSRSVQGNTTSNTMMHSPNLDIPRSALPHQRFGN